MLQIKKMSKDNCRINKSVTIQSCYIELFFIFFLRHQNICFQKKFKQFVSQFIHEWMLAVHWNYCSTLKVKKEAVSVSSLKDVDINSFIFIRKQSVAVVLTNFYQAKCAVNTEYDHDHEEENQTIVTTNV